MSKLSIKEEMRAIDCRVKGWWESLTEEEVKKISPFVLMRWTSAVQSSNSDIEFTCSASAPILFAWAAKSTETKFGVLELFSKQLNSFPPL